MLLISGESTLQEIKHGNSLTEYVCKLMKTYIVCFTYILFRSNFFLFFSVRVLKMNTIVFLIKLEKHSER